MKLKVDKKSKKDVEIDEFEDLGKDSLSFSDTDLDFDKLDEIDSPEVETTLLYRPEVAWDVNAGMNQARLHKMYSLFFDKDSAFFLGGEVKPAAKNPLNGAHCLETDSKDQQLFLYTPKSGFLACYHTESTEDAGWLDEPLKQTLIEISQFCAKATKPTTFVIPFFEMPSNMSKGVQHQVLLTISYDPKTKEITPLVYDSIGRDTYTESISSYIKGKSRSTSDQILNESIAKAVQNADPSLQANPLGRVGYNHQNRLTEGNCGSYTFRTIKEVISATAQGTKIKIPGSGYITSDSYLTSNHVKDIENCVKYRTISAVDIESSVTKGTAVPLKLSEFISALDAYYKVRENQPEKSKWNIVGYSKKAKLDAVKCLTNILIDIANGKEISESQYVNFKGHIDCLNDSSLGSLVQFHLKSSGVDSLEKLVIDHVKMDEFVMIEDDDLFDVPDLTEKELATKDKVPLLGDSLLIEKALEKQKQIKTELTDLRNDNEISPTNIVINGQ